MNRVIKFRAWDKSDKVMYTTLDFEDMMKLQIMQFTGLHDKNGKEIYEGDIVKTDLCHPSWVGTAYQVIFKDGSFQMQAHGFIRTLSFPYHIHGGVEQGIIENEKDYEQHIEIIGNIYKNPELLTKES